MAERRNGRGGGHGLLAQTIQLTQAGAGIAAGALEFRLLGRETSPQGRNREGHDA